MMSSRDDPSFARVLARIGLAAYIQNNAQSWADNLRQSASQGPPGVPRIVKESLAEIAEDGRDDPAPLVKLIESIWDSF